MSVALRLSSVYTVGNLNCLIVFPQAEENVWSNPALNERTVVKGGKTSALTGNILRRLSGYGESLLFLLFGENHTFLNPVGKRAVFLIFLSDWLWTCQ